MRYLDCILNIKQTAYFSGHLLHTNFSASLHREKPCVNSAACKVNTKQDTEQTGGTVAHDTLYLHAKLKHTEFV